MIYFKSTTSKRFTYFVATKKMKIITVLGTYKERSAFFYNKCSLYVGSVPCMTQFETRLSETLSENICPKEGSNLRRKRASLTPNHYASCPHVQ